MSERIGERHASACRYKNEEPEGSRRSARRTHFQPREALSAQENGHRYDTGAARGRIESEPERRERRGEGGEDQVSTAVETVRCFMWSLRLSFTDRIGHRNRRFCQIALRKTEFTGLARRPPAGGLAAGSLVGRCDGRRATTSCRSNFFSGFTTSGRRKRSWLVLLERCFV